jgi:hypothetical protein
MAPSSCSVSSTAGKFGRDRPKHSSPQVPAPRLKEGDRWKVLPMPSEAQIGRVYTAVCQAVGRILGSQTFEDWTKHEKLQVGDLIVFNNSFLYREGLTGTTKNKKYLCVTLDPDAEPAVPTTSSPPTWPPAPDPTSSTRRGRADERARSSGLCR